ncbi:MAG: aminoacyl-tRNA hydrolase [Acidobacteria bacterium]|nr:aminoacyl-tRNA hydrolase [Acidobacteriota bacterium]MBP7475310.1 aminoacyl-tRNA hydrolase [Pyrinomonadaceae bacterium]MBP9109357.1 aminoacyl-tRNA hydrolase [Pyrinomonadaceae bacterium]
MPTEVGAQNWLVVGLGNPGLEYAKTRHNLGFMLVDMLAQRWQTRVTRDESRSLIGRAEFDRQVIELVKPQTYMNLSGEAVSGLLTKDNRDVTKLIVISDDLALPFGTMRIRPKGTHGGQNGLRSIIDCLKTQEFIRLRIGIHPEHPIRDAARFVLENFSKGELEAVEKILETAADAIETIIRDGAEAAMARYN